MQPSGAPDLCGREVATAGDAALEPEEWPAFLGAMTKATGSELTCLLLLDDTNGAGEALWQYGVPPDAQREYPS